MFMERMIIKYMSEISNKIEKIKKLIKEADYILIGAGSGFSTSARIEYSGKRFEDNFKDFIEKYHFTDMYTSGFYNFKTEEEKWAYWARHMYLNDIGMEATELYKNILKLVENKEYFIITTNVDEQFYKTGFDKYKIFATQGSYRYIQCKNACHNKIYDASNMVKEMIKNTKDCKIPKELVSKCPVCGGEMEVNLRKDAYFVQDDNWYKQNEKYGNFLDKSKDKKVILLEFGVGFNTPGIIRFPFEEMTYQNLGWNLIRFNKDNCNTFLDIESKLIKIEDNIKDIVDKILKE